MAVKNFYDAALAHIDAQIADLQRAKAIIVAAEASASADPLPEPKPRKLRGPNKRKGLPVATSDNGE